MFPFCPLAPGLMTAEEPSCAYCLLATDFTEAVCYCREHQRCVSLCDPSVCRLCGFNDRGAQSDDEHPTVSRGEPTTTTAADAADTRAPTATSREQHRELVAFTHGATALWLGLIRYNDITRAMLMTALADARPDWDLQQRRAKVAEAMARHREESLRNTNNVLEATGQMVAAAEGPTPAFVVDVSSSSGTRKRTYGLACHNHGLCNHVGDGCGVQTGLVYTPLQPAARPFQYTIYDPRHRFCILQAAYKGIRSSCFRNQLEKVERFVNQVVGQAAADQATVGQNSVARKITRHKDIYSQAVRRGGFTVRCYSRAQAEAAFTQDNPSFPATAPMPPQVDPASAPADAVLDEAAAAAESATDTLMGEPEQQVAATEPQRASVWQRLGYSTGFIMPTDASQDQRWLSRRLRTVMLQRGDMLARFDAYGLCYVQGVHYPSPVVVHNPAGSLGLKHYGVYDNQGCLWLNGQVLDLRLWWATNEHFQCEQC